MAAPVRRELFRAKYCTKIIVGLSAVEIMGHTGKLSCLQKQNRYLGSGPRTARSQSDIVCGRSSTGSVRIKIASTTLGFGYLGYR